VPAGGVVAGRLCGAATADTARWHGFVAWCATTLVIFYPLTGALGGILGGAFCALGGVGRTAASAATGIAQDTDPGRACFHAAGSHGLPRFGQASHEAR
jgi:hypothetical protein